MTPERTPSNVDAIDGEVIVDGPDGVAVTLTADAAIETAERLFDKGVEARGQLVGQAALRKERQDLGLSD